MPRHAIQRLLFVLTLALASIVPLRASAAILQACEDDAMSMAPGPSANEPSCASSAHEGDAATEGSAAPICDPRGASAVAPPRILPVADARIEAVPTCGSSESADAIGPNRHDPAPAGEAAGPAQNVALLPHIAPLPPAGEATELLDVLVSGGPRAGVAPGVYHPPR